MNVYIVMIFGNDTCFFRVVDQETWDWIRTEKVSQPESQIQKKLKAAANWDRGYPYPYPFPPQCPSRSFMHDRAMACHPANDDYPEFNTIKSTMAAINAKGDYLQDEIHCNGDD
jgi:hypothetical protein